jgi:hypothetical protein
MPNRLSRLSLLAAVSLAALATCRLPGHLGGVAMAREPVVMQSADDRLILESFLKYAGEYAAEVTPDAVAKIDQPEEICWVWSQYLSMPLVAFRLTGDAKYLAAFVKALDVLLTRLRPGPDGYLGFRGLPYELFRNPANPTAEMDVDIAEFEVAHLICDFAELVNTEDALQQQYGGKVAAYLDLAERQLIGPKWDTRGCYVDLGTEGAIIRMPAECGNDRDSLTNPHNKQSKFCRAYLALYRVTGKDEYFRRAVKLGTRFKHTLRLEGDRYLWHYWDPAGDWDRKPGKPDEWKHWIGPEHRGGYHGLTLAMPVELYDYGVVFDRTDIQRFLNTQMQVCWNGSVDQPVFTNTEGKPITEAGQGTIIASSLGRFEPRIREFCYGPRATAGRLQVRDDSWQGGVGAMGYLLGKYGESPTPEPRQTRYRDQFSQTPGNAAFLDELRFEVK